MKASERKGTSEPEEKTRWAIWASLQEADQDLREG